MKKDFKNMLLISTVWRMKKTFKLIPIGRECPYVECIFDPESQMLAVILDKVKQSYHMVPKLDDNGDHVPTKKPRPGGESIKEERRLVDTYGEVYIGDIKDIQQLVELFAINAEVFDYMQYIDQNYNGCEDCDNETGEEITPENNKKIFTQPDIVSEPVPIIKPIDKV